MTCKCRGLTLIEALTVVAITAILVAILIPIIGTAKKSAKTSTALQNLRQLSINLDLYRSDWNGNDSSFDDYYALGLPSVNYVRTDFHRKVEKIMVSPCGVNLSAFNSALFPGESGHASPVFATADPILGPKQPVEFKDHISTYRENAVMYVDVNCNDSEVDFNDNFATKRGLAVLFSGQLVNKNSTGVASHLAWFTTKPTLK